MDDGHLRGFGRRWANHGLQARPGFAGLVGPRPRPGLSQTFRQYRRDRLLDVTTLEKAVVGAALAATVGAGMFEAHQNSKLNKRIQTLQQEQPSLIEGSEQAFSRAAQSVQEHYGFGSGANAVVN